jgi:hypothetical protein
MDKFIIMNVHDGTKKTPKLIPNFFPFSFWCMKKFVLKNGYLKKSIIIIKLSIFYNYYFILKVIYQFP